MATTNDDAREQLVRTLLQKIREDTYPSSTMLDTVEELLTPEEIPTYVLFLQERVQKDTYPSIPLIKRLQGLLQ